MVVTLNCKPPSCVYTCPCCVVSPINSQAIELNHFLFYYQMSKNWKKERLFCVVWRNIFTQIAFNFLSDCHNMLKLDRNAEELPFALLVWPLYCFWKRSFKFLFQTSHVMLAMITLNSVHTLFLPCISYFQFYKWTCDFKETKWTSLYASHSLIYIHCHLSYIVVIDML